ncbi:DUF488 domain-containing protein [Jinshanibacter sp. LJY008]|uniref:DUF488 domain-containing protein n=1 Tax=Limnobaculum eriocheiris TaxID=2897391 RepID=A0A9X1MTV1_9GAMM|nr:DUF488 domain-containing protein [Limnobaculum eriocheiris]MCD1124824.1 DUF488 domain-containing protein [Limnobaculum eriocheiris]
MKTASFFTYKGEGRICIARYAPRNTPAGFRMFQPLAPGSWFNSVSEKRYIELYKTEILGVLNPQQTWEHLHTLAGGAEPFLLCWEKPGEFCHRRLIAEWFEENLGHKVEEYSPEKSNNFSLF